ncbi:conserved hypothetical protein [Ricinus communis]|uniref:Uncharacterized protein n=1 Tax=Ricinus communis TaxID=3988 RepID=B9RP46_RICCO|nr:conserved hypothetical protein [Ricinus communis]
MPLDVLSCGEVCGSQVQRFALISNVIWGRVADWRWWRFDCAYYRSTELVGFTKYCEGFGTYGEGLCLQLTSCLWNIVGSGLVQVQLLILTRRHY